MAVTLLNRLTGNPTAKSGGTFIDASGAEWWFKSAQWANESGILSASEDKTFRPDDPISREALAQAMYNCGVFLKLDMSKRANIETFTDTAHISPEHKEAVSWAVACGIFKGNSDGSFNPTGNVTRAEMSAVLRNWLNK